MTKKFYREKIVENKIKCNECLDIIESKHTHDFKWCKCGTVAVDGGKSYLKRCGYQQHWTELSVVEQEERAPYEWEVND